MATTDEEGITQHHTHIYNQYTENSAMSKYLVATKKFDALDQSELSLQKGELVTLIHDHDEYPWYADAVYYCPSSFVAVWLLCC